MSNFEDTDFVLVGLAGRKGAGKDTAAQPLIDAGFENVKFAAPIKDMLRTFMRYVGMAEPTISRCLEGDMKEIPLTCFGGRSTRYAMQSLGTEWGRNLVWDGIWTAAFESRAKQFSQVVCTDVRMPNEVALVEDLGGSNYLVHDPRKSPDVDAHASEALVDTLGIKTVILNDGSIDDLHGKMIDRFLPESF